MIFISICHSVGIQPFYIFHKKFKIKINPFNLGLNGFINLIMRFEISDLLY